MQLPVLLSLCWVIDAIMLFDARPKILFHIPKKPRVSVALRDGRSGH